MKISSEIKVGIIGIVTIIVLIWGINYLKGRNILSSTYTLYTFYHESGGLESSAPVLLNGIKIGYVDQVLLRTGETPPIEVLLDIDKEYHIPTGSSAEMFSTNLLGNKAIRIVLSGNGQNFNDLDTIEALVALDVLSGLQESIFPILDQVSTLAGSLDTLSRELGILIADEALAESLAHLSSITGSLKTSLDPGGSLDNSFRNLESFTGMLNEQEEEMASMIGNLNSVSAGLDSAGLGKLASELHEVSVNINTLLAQVNSGKGSAGKLFYSDSLYDNLEILIADLDLLVKDLNENPEDYVHISVFGRSKEKKK